MESGNETVVFRDRGAVAVEDRPVPDPEPNEVLIETTHTLISTGTELTVLTEDYPRGSAWEREFPYYPGYNNVGEVVATGDAVEGAVVGDRVASYGRHAQYVTATGPGRGADPFDTYRSVPDGIDDRSAALFTFAEIAMNAVRRGRLTWGESVAVFGLGLLGQFAVRVARFAGAVPVIGLDVAPSRLEYLPESPRVLGIDPDGSDATGSVATHAPRGAVDLVIEATGNPEAIPQQFDPLREQGRLVILSSPRGETAFDFHDHCNAGSYEIIGAHNASHPSVALPQAPWTQHRHADLYFRLVADGALPVDGLVSHSYDATDAESAYDLLLEDRTRAMGVLLEW